MGILRKQQVVKGLINRDKYQKITSYVINAVAENEIQAYETENWNKVKLCS